MTEIETVFDTAKEIVKGGAIVVIAGAAFYVVLTAVEFLGGLF